MAAGEGTPGTSSPASDLSAAAVPVAQAEKTLSQIVTDIEAKTAVLKDLETKVNDKMKQLDAVFKQIDMATKSGIALAGQAVTEDDPEMKAIKECNKLLEGSGMSLPFPKR